MAAKGAGSAKRMELTLASITAGESIAARPEYLSVASASMFSSSTSGVDCSVSEPCWVSHSGDKVLGIKGVDQEPDLGDGIELFA